MIKWVFSSHTLKELFSGDIRPNQILLMGILQASWAIKGLCFNRKAISKQDKFLHRGRFLVRRRSVSSGLSSKKSWRTSQESLTNSLKVTNIAWTNGKRFWIYQYNFFYVLVKLPHGSKRISLGDILAIIVSNYICYIRHDVNGSSFH